MGGKKARRIYPMKIREALQIRRGEGRALFLREGTPLLKIRSFPSGGISSFYSGSILDCYKKSHPTGTSSSNEIDISCVRKKNLEPTHFLFFQCLLRLLYDKFEYALTFVYYENT